jgi:hypothetical protein
MEIFMPPKKLTYEIAETIRARCGNGEKQTAMAREYGVDQGTIWALLNHLTWKRPEGQARRPKTPVGPRLWQRIEVCAHGRDCIYCCWPWWGCKKGGKPPYNYGSIVEDGKQRSAHVVAWEQWHNRPLPAGKFGLHYCHNSGCANPSHTYPGTALQNVQDMDKAGRRVGTKGMKQPHARAHIQRVNAKMRIQGHPQTHLTIKDVETIRAIHAAGLRKQGIRRKDLAAQYGLSLGGLDHILYEDGQTCYKPA